MASNAVEGSSLDKLQTPEQVALLDTIDQLRNQGLSHHNISLPQLIVCGDQSSGKSSVLEGLTRLKFPAKEGLCTTFATELILRKHPVVAISCTLVPGKSRTLAQKEELARFQRCYSSREDFAFPDLIDDARECMAFGAQSENGTFYEDVLQIKYSGPDLPSLTIVDLPGIIKTQIRTDANGVKTVRNLVQRYMADDKSIILAVVHAKSDLETQSVLKYVRKHDRSASRTLGIITKPDKLDAGSESEQVFLKLARNQSMALNLGWHVVRNRDFGERELTDAERDESERHFFSKGVWADLPRANVGIETLREKLSRVLLQHIRRELPNLTEAIQKAVATTEASLNELGDSREELHEQRIFLMEKAQRFQMLTVDAMRGINSDPFFHITSMHNSTHKFPPRRLRAEIHNLNLKFAHVMHNKGHRWQIVEDTISICSGSGDFGLRSFSSSALDDYAKLEAPEEVKRSEFLRNNINMHIELGRPSGLYSSVNPGVIGEIFRQQSKPWEAVARKHLDAIYKAVHAYVEESLSSDMSTETFSALMQELIQPELEKRQKRVDDKLKELLVSYREGEPVTYDPTFEQDIYQLRMKRMLKARQAQSGVSTSGAQKNGSSSPVDILTPCDILDRVETYYKKAISVFISNITILAIENCLLTDLPTLLNPALVLNMNEDTLFAIAAESEHVRNERSSLTRRLADLREGKSILESQAKMSAKNIRSSPARLRRRQQLDANSTATGREGARPRTPIPDDTFPEEDKLVNTPTPATQPNTNSFLSSHFKRADAPTKTPPHSATKLAGAAPFSMQAGGGGVAAPMTPPTTPPKPSKASASPTPTPLQKKDRAKAGSGDGDGGESVIFVE